MNEILIGLEKVKEYMEDLKKREYVNRYSKPLEDDTVFVKTENLIYKIIEDVKNEIKQ